MGKDSQQTIQENELVSLTDLALYSTFDFVQGVPDDDLYGMEDGPDGIIYLIIRRRQETGAILIRAHLKNTLFSCL